MYLPIISVIVPCYNQGEFLEEALSSVLNQTSPNWECIIVNDGSCDSTSSVATLFINKDSRFSYIENDGNQGLAVSRNVGIRASRGCYILPLDADDKIGERYIEKALEYYKNFPETKVVYSRAKLFGLENKEWILPEYNFESMIWTNCLFCSSVFLRKDFDKTNGYNQNMRYGFEDWDFWLSVLTPESKVHRIDDVLFYYRKKTYSMSSDTYRHLNDAYVQIHDNHPELYAPYYRQIIAIKRGEVVQKEFYQNILHSKSYILGNILLKPFFKLISMLK